MILNYIINRNKFPGDEYSNILQNNFYVYKNKNEEFSRKVKISLFRCWRLNEKKD